MTDAIKRSHTQAWMRIWEKEIQEVYGSTAEEITSSTCAYRLLSGTRISEVQRRAYQAFGELDPPTPERKGKLESNRLGDLGTTAEEGAPWTEDEVRKQRLFFNCWYREGTPLTGRSTLEVETRGYIMGKNRTHQGR